MARKIFSLALIVPLIAALILAPISARADGFMSTPSATGTATTGQIPGTATNDSASAGNVGEVLTNSATTVSLTTSTGKTVTSQSLTAGDWDVQCIFKWNPAATTSVADLIGEVSPTADTAPQTLGNYSRIGYGGGITFGGRQISWPTPVVRVSVAVTTTYFCAAQSEFSTSTMTADAKLVARRRR